MKNAKHIVAPKYRELSVAKLWPYIKEVQELSQYFPNLNDGELPEKDYTWTIISTVNPEATSKFIQDAKKYRGSQDLIGQDQLVEFDPALFKEIEEVAAQKGITTNFYYFPEIQYSSQRLVLYMLKRGSKLRRSRQPAR